jgi:hypothetical protein
MDGCNPNELNKRVKKTIKKSKKKIQELQRGTSFKIDEKQNKRNTTRKDSVM